MPERAGFADLARTIVTLPGWRDSALVSLALGALAGLPLLGGPLWLRAFDGALYVGVPTVATGAVTVALDAGPDGDCNCTPNRSFGLALVGEVVVLALWAAGWTAASLTGRPVVVVEAVIAGLAITAGLRTLALVAISRRSFVWTGVVAALQPAFALVAPAVSVALGRPAPVTASLVGEAAADGGYDLVVLVALVACYVVAAYGLLRAIDRPVRRSLHVTSLDFAHGVFRYLAGDPAALESFFATFADAARVRVGALAFRRPDGSEKARFVAPGVHPGPMGTVGGGRLPVKLAEAAEGLCFPLHGTAGHDFNPVDQANVDAVVAAVSDVVDDATATRATPTVRTRVRDAVVLGQRFGSVVLGVATFAPEPADDIEYSVGLAMAGGLGGDGDAVVLADAHNSNDGDAGVDPGFVSVGSTRARALEVAAERTGERLRSRERDALRVGVASAETEWGIENGVGPLGVRVAVVESGDYRTAYVLADANNAAVGFRDHVREAVLEHVDEAEVLTTDTHLVTRTTAVNQLGDAVDWEAFTSVAVECTRAALDDLEPVCAAGGESAVDVDVFGSGRVEQFESLANVMVVVGLATIAAGLVAAFAANVLLFSVGP